MLFNKCVGSLTSPADYVTLKMQETGPTAYLDFDLAWINWNEWRSVLKSNNSENNFSESSNGSRAHDLPEYRLHALTTELWRPYTEQSRKLGSYAFWEVMGSVPVI